MNKTHISMISGIAFLAIGAIYGLSGITDIDPGEVGLIVQKIGVDQGIRKETLNTGLHWVEPVANDTVIYDTRDKQYFLYDPESKAGIQASTKDGQPITVDISLQLGLLDAAVPVLHEMVGGKWFGQVVYPLGRSVTRENTSRLLSDEIYTGEGRQSVREGIEKELKTRLNPLGVRVEVNLRDIKFTNPEFIKTLEEKAAAAQKVIIKEREAEAAVNEAIRVANIAEGEKQKRIKAAEADKEERRLEGEGDRLKQEEQAKGLLALAKSKAEGTRLQVLAYGSGEIYASVKWAENLGPNVKVYGIPTGSPGTASMMDLNGILKGAFGGIK